MEYNFKIIGNRIRDLRNSKGWNQDRLVEEIRQYCGSSRNTLSKIENGNSESFTLDFLLSCCKIFHCDIGFLLGEHECKTIEVQSIQDYTGLRESTIYQLHHWHDIWGAEITNTIAVLVEDMLYHNVDGVRGYQPILQLLTYFLNFQDSSKQQLVFSNGSIQERKNFKFLPSNAIALDSTIIENATLAEVQYALKSLKKSLTDTEDK